MRKTNKSLNTINFTVDDILSVIKKIDPNKAHGHDQISIRMLEICDKTKCKPLYLIFSSCIESRIFPIEWKMVNLVRIHKRDDKQNVKIYRPGALLSKTFDKIWHKGLRHKLVQNGISGPLLKILTDFLKLRR